MLASILIAGITEGQSSAFNDPIASESNVTVYILVTFGGLVAAGLIRWWRLRHSSSD